MNTVEEIYEACKNWEGDEVSFNRYLLEKIYDGSLTYDAFLEYLEITQADVMECLEESLGE